MTSVPLGIVEGPDLDPAGERVALGIEAFALLDLPVPPDFGAPGSRRQILVDAGGGVVAYTVAAAAAGGSGEVVQMSDAALGRLLMDEPPRSPVDVTADILGRCELVETTVLRSCADVAVIAPHGGSIERATDAQAEQVDVVNRLATLGGLQIEQGLALRSTRDAPEVVAEVVSHELAALAARTPAEGPTGQSPGGRLAYDDA